MLTKPKQDAKKAYAVLPNFYLHKGKSVHRPGSIVQLTDEEARAHAHQIESYPLSHEVIASRAARPAQDSTRRDYIVRSGFVAWFGEECYPAGSVLSLTKAEAALHPQLELLADYVPPAPPPPEDLTARAYTVRPGFHAHYKGEVHTGGAVLHMTATDAAAYAHMLEATTAKAARAA